VLVVSDATKGLEADCERAALRIVEREVGWVVPADEALALLHGRTAHDVPA
jgi:hypothetical protein